MWKTTSVADFMIRRARITGFASAAENLAALIEEILRPGAGGVVGDEIEFVPETVQTLLARLVENQFLQRIVVTPVAHHIVIAGAEQAARILRVIGEETAALLNVERVGEDTGESRE